MRPTSTSAPAPPHRGAARRGWSRGERLAGVAVLALLLLAYLPGLTTPTLLPDERTYLEAGQRFIDSAPAINLEHPPLAKLLFGAGGSVVGDPLLGGRLVAVAAGVLVAMLLFRLVGAVAGRGWGLAAAGVWAVLPHSLRAPEQALGGFDKLDRYAMLDVVAAALALAAVVAAWRWWRSGGLPWGVAAGVLVGLAGGAKMSAWLVLPVVAAVPLGRARWRPARPVLRDGLVLGAAAVGAFALPYLVAHGTDAVGAFRDMIDFQSAHAANGHSVVLAGERYARAPWWIHLYYHWRDDGPALSLVFAVGGAVGALARTVDRRVRLLLAGAVLVPAVVLSASPVGLPHYRFVWLPPLVALAVLGVRQLAAAGRAGRAVAAAMAAVVVVMGGATVWHTATAPIANYRATAVLLDERGLESPTVLVRGFAGLLTYYAPHVTLVTEMPADVVVLDPKSTDLDPVPRLRARLEDDPAYAHVEVDRLDVWIRR